MNLRLVQFSLGGTDTRSAAESIADEIVPEIRRQPGCERCSFFADYDSGDYGIVVFWESADAAEAAKAVIAPKLGAALQKTEVKSDVRKLFEIYEPSS